MANSEEWLYNDVLDVDLEEVSHVSSIVAHEKYYWHAKCLFLLAGAAESRRVESIGRRHARRGFDCPGRHYS